MVGKPHRVARRARPASGENTTLRPGREGLRELTVQDIIDAHDEVARIGETWDFGVRDAGNLDLMVTRVRRMVEGGLPPAEIAAAVMCLIVAEHPFWDANHRTGFEMAQLVLRAFGMKVVAPRDEIERYVRGIDRDGLTASQMAAWIRRRAEPLR